MNLFRKAKLNLTSIPNFQSSSSPAVQSVWPSGRLELCLDAWAVVGVGLPNGVGTRDGRRGRRRVAMIHDWTNHSRDRRWGLYSRDRSRDVSRRLAAWARVGLALMLARGLSPES